MLKKANLTEEADSGGTSELPGKEETRCRFPFTSTPFSPVLRFIVDIVDSLWVQCVLLEFLFLF